ncbi:hypothetical protein Pcinc_004771 [Petrolisthes cinctipes]|uniref:Uncharacterized protein n=1 Tax=Petrolisthes cinctipes TaxID=88211 RepID=A0AAE1G0X2_PETCI|nr:hypothetical protein Pcinc_014164 [Petrolisthes cinctipes]KAK3891327.1 hypothetical protein Pcinc_004771 [Petrolisthes cinctipes]
MVIKTCKAMGFAFNLPKSQLVPTQQLPWLGMLGDTQIQTLLTSTNKVVVSSSPPCNVNTLDYSCSQHGCHYRRILYRMGSSVVGGQSGSRPLDTNLACLSLQ